MDLGEDDSDEEDDESVGRALATDGVVEALMEPSKDTSKILLGFWLFPPSNRAFLELIPTVLEETDALAVLVCFLPRDFFLGESGGRLPLLPVEEVDEMVESVLVLALWKDGN